MALNANSRTVQPLPSHTAARPSLALSLTTALLCCVAAVSSAEAQHQRDSARIGELSSEVSSLQSSSAALQAELTQTSRHLEQTTSAFAKAKTAYADESMKWDVQRTESNAVRQ